MPRNFELAARAIIIQRGKILVCRAKGMRWFFFPGGHIEFGESAEKALKREIKEEFGASVKKCTFIGTVENVFIEDREKHHELNLVFYVKITPALIRAIEDHLVIYWKDLSAPHRERVLPHALKKSVLKWLRDKKIFWASQMIK